MSLRNVKRARRGTQTLVVRESQPTQMVVEGTVKRKSKRSTKYSKLLYGHTNSETKNLTFFYQQNGVGSTLIAPYQKRWAGNSPYDPDPDIGGNSAFGYDTMMARYDKCYVKTCTAELITSHNSNGALPTMCMWFDDMATEFVSVEPNDVVGRCLANGGKVIPVHSMTGNGPFPTKVKINTTDIFKDGFKDEELSGTAVVGNPVKMYYLHVVCLNGGQDMVAGANAMNVSTKLTYETVFYQPKAL